MLAIQTTVTVADQFDRDRVDTSMTGVLTGGQRRQRARIGAGQIPANIGNCGGDQVEVVEEPVRRRYDKLPGAYIVRQRAIRSAQHADVVLESRKRVSGAVARIGIDRQAGRERQRTLLEPLDA